MVTLKLCNGQCLTEYPVTLGPVHTLSKAVIWKFCNGPGHTELPVTNAKQILSAIAISITGMEE